MHKESLETCRPRSFQTLWEAYGAADLWWVSQNMEFYSDRFTWGFRACLREASQLALPAQAHPGCTESCVVTRSALA